MKDSGMRAAFSTWLCLIGVLGGPNFWEQFYGVHLFSCTFNQKYKMNFIEHVGEKMCNTKSKSVAPSVCPAGLY